jgi:hypothetical protein
MFEQFMKRTKIKLKISSTVLWLLCVREMNARQHRNAIFWCCTIIAACTAAGLIAVVIIVVHLQSHAQ